MEQKRIYPSGCFILQTDLDEVVDKCTLNRMYFFYSMLKNGFMRGL